MTLLVAWILFGYLLFIWFAGLLRRDPIPSFPSSWPMMSIVVPCYNESDQILGKLEDLRRIEYPRDRMEVVFADGGSSDRTPEMLDEAIGKDEPFRVVRCPRKGKINQLNHVLPSLRGSFVVNTDADARLAADAVKWMAAEFILSIRRAVI